MKEDRSKKREVKRADMRVLLRDKRRLERREDVRQMRKKNRRWKQEKKRLRHQMIVTFIPIVKAIRCFVCSTESLLLR